MSVLFGLTISAFVSIHSWTAIFLLFWALACVAALIFLLAAVARYVAHLVRTRATVEDLASGEGSNSQERPL
jgi:hypothetical protein